MKEALREARTTMNAADEAARTLAELLAGRLRKVNSTYYLKQLKRELRDFNIHTGQWK